MGQLDKDIYCQALLAKYGKDPAKMPVWVLLELFSFGSFIDLYLFCGHRWEDASMLNEHYYLRQAKSVRNACAHSSNMINGFGVQDDEIKTNPGVGAALAKTGLSHRVRTSKMKNPRLKQIVTLMYLHADLVTAGSGRRRAVADMQILKTKMESSRETFAVNDNIRSSIDFLCKLIDCWFV